MKRLTGNFDVKNDYDSFISWLEIVKSSREQYSTTIPTNIFAKGGEIIFEETTVHGALLLTTLLADGWTEDTSFDPAAQQTRDDADTAAEDAKIATQKTRQDTIDATDNKPSIIIILDAQPYNDLDKTTRDTLAYAELSEYQSQMTRKQNRISDILKLKELADTKANWDTEGAKTISELEAEIITLRNVVSK